MPHLAAAHAGSARARAPAPPTPARELRSDPAAAEQLYFEQLEENRKRSRAQHPLENICEINSELDLDALLRRLAETIAASLGFRIVLIRLREPGTDRLRARAFAGLEPAARARARSAGRLLIETS